MANPADKSDVVLIERPTAPVRPSGPHCATCPNFSDTSNPKQIADRAKLGVEHKGECLLQPMPVWKTPHSVCGQHPEMLARQNASAFGPLVAQLGQLLGSRK